ncbi:RDD family protein [Rhizobium rhizogenes]|uniref:RDD family protein n=1 Tax=Rhizobium rhizogenes TaxID=359 RepID=UPI001574CEFF|nr:RDD family protein [Rhizobium rhizogenes]NTF45931.1 RDD family protein [Rhizobium rhizogenes]
MSEYTQGTMRMEQFIPPEGVPISFAIASLGTRLGAQCLDLIFTFLLVLVCAVALAFGGFLPPEAAVTLVILLAFLIRTPYYILSELVWNGRTLGKRITGIRVVNVNGRRLTPHQVTARNLMKEVEIFTPLTLALAMGSMSVWEGGVTSAWILTVLIVPLANKRRQRLGDIIAGTLVVDNPRSVLLSDLVISAPMILPAQVAFDFLPEHLDVYGKYELQTLEDVLRDPTKSSGSEEIAEIVRTIIRKIKFPDAVKTGQEMLFLTAFYRAQREHLETLRLFGTRRENKFHQAEKTVGGTGPDIRL